MTVYCVVGPRTWWYEGDDGEHQVTGYAVSAENPDGIPDWHFSWGYLDAQRLAEASNDARRDLAMEALTLKNLDDFENLAP